MTLRQELEDNKGWIVLILCLTLAYMVSYTAKVYIENKHYTEQNGLAQSNCCANWPRHACEEVTGYNNLTNECTYTYYDKYNNKMNFTIKKTNT